MIEKTVKEIRSMQIRGARATALAGLTALKEATNQSKTKKTGKLKEEMFEWAKKLAGARPTEPGLRNVLASVLTKLKQSKSTTPKKLRRLLVKSCKEEEKSINKMQARIAKIGARRISSEARIFTHCHSSTVVETLEEAHKDGKKIEAICTETRPLMQGRITARKLSNLGIQTTFIVDSAARTFLKNADLVLIGADVICANGAVINKIGSAMIGSIAKELRKPLFIAAGSYKFDPLTFRGYIERIEERPPEEIVEPSKLPKVQIRNPVFDAIAPDRIDSIITELGALPPSQAYELGKKYDYSLLEKLR